MRFFGRRQPSEPDIQLASLSPQQSRRLVDESIAALARLGVTAVYDDDGGLRDTDNTVYGLWNLAAHLAEVPEHAWPHEVQAHFERMLVAMKPNMPQNLDEARSILQLRVRPDVPEFPATPTGYPQAIGPGLALVAAYDFPTHVSDLHDPSHLQALGPWPTVYEVALNNLRSLPAPSLERWRADPDEPTSEVLAFVADDVFGASRLVVLDELLASVVVDAPHGVLVAVPDRAVLLVHALTGQGVATAMNDLINLTQQRYLNEPGTISGDVYYRPNPQHSVAPLQQITEYHGTECRVLVRDGFADAMAALGLTG